jgi:[DsrC]-trisulfide reductase subunit J
MRERHVIVAALVVFIALVTVPFWYARAGGVSAAAPDVKLPEHEKACVMPVDYMRASHMDLLVTWRDQVVRQGARTWTAPDGKAYTASLSGTCLRCHENKAEFCDRCHDYAGVTPSCWNCHVDPAAIKRSRG